MRKILLTLVLLIGSGYLFAQGVTTASIIGKVADENGSPLIGTTIVALHEPSGTQYGSVADVEGFFRIPNVRIGGPYKITASFVGYETQVIKDVNLSLGEKRNFSFSMNESAETLQEIVVSAVTDDLINSGRTGASTNVSADIINGNPSINRSIEDFVRLTPQAATGVGNGGISIAGSNSRYNNITIDGAINNDAFGLNSDGLPGSSSGSEPISLDAIEEISILVAPYDVTKGSFTGGGINAVTRSGTNTLEGSGYYYVRNENFAGKTLGENPERQAPFFNKQYGVRVGGPIIKDKLHFFANVEREVSETPNQISLVSQ
ncbi:MAG: carboxypeptidase regulatory-like domain-containing protein, partial [Bacteroidota bacterium]